MDCLEAFPLFLFGGDGGGALGFFWMGGDLFAPGSFFWDVEGLLFFFGGGDGGDLWNDLGALGGAGDLLVAFFGLGDFFESPIGEGGGGGGEGVGPLGGLGFLLLLGEG